MHPIDFEGSNLTLKKPDNMTDEQCMSAPAMRGVDDDNFHFVLTVWQPNKEDIEAIKAGRPIHLKVLGQSQPPMVMYTTDENFNPNV